MPRLTRRFHLSSAVRPSSLRIDPDEALGYMAEGALLVDVRRLDDRSGALAAAERIPPDMIPMRLEGLREEVAIVLACT